MHNPQKFDFDQDEYEDFVSATQDFLDTKEIDKLFKNYLIFLEVVKSPYRLEAEFYRLHEMQEGLNSISTLVHSAKSKILARIEFKR